MTRQIVHLYANSALHTPSGHSVAAEAVLASEQGPRPAGEAHRKSSKKHNKTWRHDLAESKLEKKEAARKQAERDAAAKGLFRQEIADMYGLKAFNAATFSRAIVDKFRRRGHSKAQAQGFSNLGHSPSKLGQEHLAFTKTGRVPVPSPSVAYIGVRNLYPRECKLVERAIGEQTYSSLVEMCQEQGKRQVLRVKGTTTKVKVKGVSEDRVVYVLCVLMLEALLQDQSAWELLINSSRCRTEQKLTIFEILPNCEEFLRMIKLDVHTPDIFSNPTDARPKKIFGGSLAADVVERWLAVILQQLWPHVPPAGVMVVKGKGDGSVRRAVMERLDLLVEQKTLVESYNADIKGGGAILIKLRAPRL